MDDGLSDALAGLISHHESGHSRRLRSYPTYRPRPADHLLIYVLAGTIDVVAGATPARATAGDLVAFAAGQPQRYTPHPETGWEWLWVHYGGELAARFHARIAGSQPVRPFGFDEQVVSRFTELVGARAVGSRPSPLYLDSCLASLLGLIVERLDRAPRHPPPRPASALTSVRSYIADHLGEPMELADLTAVAGLSASTLSRLFTDQLGVTPMQHVGRLRIWHAAALLRSTSLSVAEIARSVGFVDPYHFSRRFRQVTGSSPTAYRIADPAPAQRGAVSR